MADTILLYFAWAPQQWTSQTSTLFNWDYPTRIPKQIKNDQDPYQLDVEWLFLPKRDDVSCIHTQLWWHLPLPLSFGELIRLLMHVHNPIWIYEKVEFLGRASDLVVILLRRCNMYHSGNGNVAHPKLWCGWIYMMIYYRQRTSMMFL